MRVPLDGTEREGPAAINADQLFSAAVEMAMVDHVPIAVLESADDVVAGMRLHERSPRGEVTSSALPVCPVVGILRIFLVAWSARKRTYPDVPHTRSPAADVRSRA